MLEAIAIGPFLFWTRVAFLLIGVWLSVEFFLRLARSAHLSLQHFLDNSWWYLAGFLLCGRAIAILSQYRVYMKDPLRVFVVWDGGFSFLGGAIGIALVLYWATYKHRSTFLQWLDVLTPATMLGMAFDWLGKFFAGQAYGTPTDVFWGVTYDAINVRYVVPIHPVQLYYAITFFILTFLLLVIRKHSKRAGAETLWGTFMAMTATFLFEYFRGDFSIPIFATKLDFIVLIALFLSLGVFAAIELKVSRRTTYIYGGVLILASLVYFFIRNWLPFSTSELRFNQFLSVLALLATVVYVVVHRRKYPHL